MVFWMIFGGLIAAGSAIYLASFGIWAARQKNWLGAVGIWTVALLTLTAPLIVFLVIPAYRW
ncbi:MAG: hypothetical protein GX755_09660 [Syntrophomonadaceae bacterium]|nr:hypothetical protein [Syntrophomonadaceae bacterium]